MWGWEGKRYSKKDRRIVKVETRRTERKTIEWEKEEIKVKLRHKTTARQKKR